MRFSVLEKWNCVVHVGRKRSLRRAETGTISHYEQNFYQDLPLFLEQCQKQKMLKNGQNRPRPNGKTIKNGILSLES